MRKDTRGVSMVEFDFVIIVLLLIVLGTIEFGLIWYTKYVMACATRDGVAVVRAAAESPSLDNVPIRISGDVRRFEVNARRKGGVKIVNEANVALSVTASGGSLSTPFSQATTISAKVEDLFVTPDGLREALFSSANAAAEEAARRLLDAGVVVPPSPGK